MPRAVHVKSIRTPAEVRDGVIYLAASEMRQAAGTWHSLIARVSGGIVLAYGKQGVKKAEVRTWIQHLRQVADDMEKFL